MRHMRFLGVLIISTMGSVQGRTLAEPVGTAFTYQGQLKQGGVPVNGTVDLRFTLWDAQADGASIDEQIIEAVDILNGLFTVSLDFGADIFDGSAYWIEVAVRFPTGVGEYVPLTPRQKLTPTPYALALPGLRTQQNDTSPNVIGGWKNNSVTAGVRGATISGGGEFVAAGSPLLNRITDHYGTVSGGLGNTAGDSTGGTQTAEAATVGGGGGNSATGGYATVGGGGLNYAAGSFATVAGGDSNYAVGGYASVPGGMGNQAGGDYSFAAGRRATARDANATGDVDGDEGTFIWADSTDAGFTSTGPDQFLVRASGGVGIGTDSPENQLSVAGNADFTGSVGVGTATPMANLDVVSASSLSTAINVVNTSSTQRFLFQVNGDAPGGQNREGNLEIVGFGPGHIYHVLTATPEGNVGVNTYNPRSAFSVDGVADFNGLVGIGTATPTANLDVVSAHPTGTAINIMNNDSVQRFLLQVNGNNPDGQGREGNFEIWGTGPSGNHNVLTATPAGKVGIGTGTPSNALSVVGTADFSGLVGIGTTSPGYMVPSSKLEVSGGHIALSNNYGIFSANAAGTAIGAGFDTGPDDTLDLYAGGTKKVRITSSGKVGIGTSAPEEPLHVVGNIRATDRLISDAITINGQDNTINSSENLDLRTGDTSRIFIDGATGNVGIGTSAPTRRLHVTDTQAGALTYPLKVANGGNSAGTAAGMLLQVDSGTDRGKGAIVYERKTTWNRGDLHFLQNNAADPDTPTLDDAVMTIRNAGWIGMGTTTPAAQLDITSDNTSWTGVNIKNLTTDQRYIVQVNGTQPGVTRAGNLEIWGTGAGGNHNVFTATSSGNIGFRNQTPAYPLQIGTTALDGNGAHVTAGGVWTNGSDRNSKRDFEPIDKRSILAKVAELPVTKWRYKGESDSIRHIGPVAQDFHAAFGLGASDRHIGTLDAEGVALAAIQGLHQMVKDRDAQIETLRTQSASLRARLEELETIVAELSTIQNGDVQ